MSKYYDSERKASPGPSGSVYSSEHSGMPTQPVMKDYPNGKYSMEGEYSDTVNGIDMFASKIDKKLKGQMRTLGDS
ncbi:MAG: hypothetical protein ACE5RC_00070 [Nitrosopumilus sp.]